MTATSSAELVKQKCASCEVAAPITLPEAEAHMMQLHGWHLTHNGQRIRKEWIVKDFMCGVDFFNRCAKVAEGEEHHPDLHLEGYRNVAVELWTHEIGGLSANDFIVAAKIDQLPIDLKST